MKIVSKLTLSKHIRFKIYRLQLWKSNTKISNIWTKTKIRIHESENPFVSI